jgi:hypothetical protein
MMAENKSNSISGTLRTSINIPFTRLGEDRTRVKREGKVIIPGERVQNFDFDTHRTTSEAETLHDRGDRTISVAPRRGNML